MSDFRNNNTNAGLHELGVSAPHDDENANSASIETRSSVFDNSLLVTALTFVTMAVLGPTGAVIDYFKHPIQLSNFIINSTQFLNDCSNSTANYNVSMTNQTSYKNCTELLLAALQFERNSNSFLASGALACIGVFLVGLCFLLSQGNRKCYSKYLCCFFSSPSSENQQLLSINDSSNSIDAPKSFGTFEP